MRFTVVIPTYERRAMVVAHVRALARQTLRDFEVVVVDDGSSDGTADALRALGDAGFPLTVLAQANAGAAAARNAGAAVAGGELLLFLDDDMEADVVLGDLPLHAASPRTLLSRGVGEWARSRGERLSAPGAAIGRDDLLTGQISIARAAFERLGGFDVAFTRDGLFGGEDIDFGLRVLDAGLRVVFEPAAVSFQRYEVDARTYLVRARENGRSEEELALKHPGQHRAAAGPDWRGRRSRRVLEPLVHAPDWVIAPLRAAVTAGVESGHRGVRLRKAFFAVRTLEHKRGRLDARRAGSTGRVAVLAFHAIADWSGEPLAPYGYPPERFTALLDDLAAHGHAFVSLDDVLAALDGHDRLPDRAVLVTFDDGYADNAAAAEELAHRGIPAVVFAVADHVGGTNAWDTGHGGRPMPLLDADGLRGLHARGVAVGSHTATHPRLPRVDDLEPELAGAAAKLEALGLPRPVALAYPYGESDDRVAVAARAAGHRVAFTVEPGLVERGVDPYALPRIEVLASDTPRRLRRKVTALRLIGDRW